MPDYDQAIERLWEMILDLNKDQCETMALLLDTRIEVKRMKEDIILLKSGIYDLRSAIDKIRGEIAEIR